MSGLGNFSLSSLGSMSTLGTLAQSAQRLDRLMAGNRSRQQEGNYGRNNSRRSVDDDFFGGRSSDRSRRRSPSPPRRFNRDDNRHSDDRRDRRRSHDDNIYGSTSGAGILGAAPSRNDRPSMNSGLGDVGGPTWNDSSANPAVNLNNSQTQQLLNMMQTQQLLAAVQAQAKLSNQSPPSLMGNAGYSRQGGRVMNQRGGRFNRNDPPRQGAYNRRDDRKRRRSPPPRPFKRERRDVNTARKDQNAKKSTTADKDAAKKDTKQEGKETKVKPQAKGVEGKDKKQDTPPSETKISTNAAGEEIEELMKTNYDGKRYWCTLCKVVCLKSKNIDKHFMSERHVKATVEKQGKVFDPEIMKQQEPKKEKPQTKDISEVLKYVCSTKQTAKKENNDIYISSLTDCTVKITDFTTEQDFMGSEFVKAVSGFKCQLCKIFMRHGHQIIEHLKGKKHYTNYKKYLKENPDYLDNQRVVNKNLVDMLKKDEGKEVVLQENSGNIYKAGDADLNSTLEEKGEEADFSMDEYDPNENSKVDDDDSKMADESSFNDSAINDSIQDHSLVESEKEIEENKTEETEEKTEAKEIEEENDVEKKEIEKEEVEKEEVEKEEVEKEEVEKEETEVEKEDLGEVSEAKDKEFSMEADEEEEEFPLLQPPTNPIKEDETIEPEVKAKPEVEAKVPEVDTEPKESETPSEPAAEPEEAEEVTPSRRGRKSKRGRGGTKAARGRRTTPRAAKNAKKIEKVVEPEEEVVDAPMETEKEQEKEGEPVVPLAQVGTDSAEELPSSQETEEVVSPQKSAGSGDVQEIDGFEVIDEVEGGSGDDSEDDE